MYTKNELEMYMGSPNGRYDEYLKRQTEKGWYTHTHTKKKQLRVQVGQK